MCKQSNVAELGHDAFAATPASSAQRLASVVTGDFSVMPRAVLCALTGRASLAVIEAIKRFWFGRTPHR